MFAVPIPPERHGRSLVRMAALALFAAVPATADARQKPPTVPPPLTTAQPAPTPSAFEGDGMWIWYVNQSSGGTAASIARRAQASGIETLFIKSSDGRRYWSQFNTSFVNELKSYGLHVCGWQYVYGRNPSAEAKVGGMAVKNGAECLVIDAEAEYEGRYAAASTYMRKLRAYAGQDFPIGLAGFPYVDYHPSFPYSVFLGTNGAQFNVPQAYWKTIGGGVDAVVDHTYRFNRPYGRTIAPLGQTYDSPPSSEILRFRQLAAADGATGLSWWSWQHTSAAGWNAVGQGITQLSSAPSAEFATLAKGNKGDLVLWAQQHLKGAGESVPLDGNFGATTQTAVKHFQTTAGLPVTGAIDTATWQALLQHVPAKAKWSATHGAPATAKLRARHYEIPPRGGAGWHSFG